MDYNAMRHFADSWGLVYMVAIFLIMLGFMVRPGAREQAKNASQIPFNEDR